MFGANFGARRIGQTIGMAPDYQPMTLGNMRESGVRSLHVWCGNGVKCHHQAVVDVERYPNEISRAGLRPAHGVHAVWFHRRRCAAELERGKALRRAGIRKAAPPERPPP